MCQRKLGVPPFRFELSRSLFGMPQLIFCMWPSVRTLSKFNPHITPATLSLVQVGLPASVPSDNRLPFPVPVFLFYTSVQDSILYVLFVPLRTYAKTFEPSLIMLTPVSFRHGLERSCRYTTLGEVESSTIPSRLSHRYQCTNTALFC